MAPTLNVLSKVYYIGQYLSWKLSHDGSYNCVAVSRLGSRHVGYRTTIFWGTDLSAPQRQFAGEPTCLGSNADVRLVAADPDIAIRVRFVRK